jgi:hypothetical protein
LAIALKELSKSLTAIDAVAPVAVPVAAGVVVVGLVVAVVVLLLQAAIRSAAAVAAATPRPLFADTEYNGVPRSISRDMPSGRCETGNRHAWSMSARVLMCESVGLRAETFELAPPEAGEKSVNVAAFVYSCTRADTNS